MMPRDPNWRRTILALAFVGAGMAMTLLAIGLVMAVLADRWPADLARLRLAIIGHALYAALTLIGLVLVGLGMSVALRQVSARFLGADFTASGGEQK